MPSYSPMSWPFSYSFNESSESPEREMAEVDKEEEMAEVAKEEEMAVVDQEMMADHDMEVGYVEIEIDENHNWVLTGAPVNAPAGAEVGLFQSWSSVHFSLLSAFFNHGLLFILVSYPQVMGQFYVVGGSGSEEDPFVLDFLHL